MSTLSPQEAVYYRDLYRLVTDPIINDLLVKYAKIQYDIAIRSSRSKKELYDYGYGNGQADAWQDIINLKDKLTKIINNV